MVVTAVLARVDERGTRALGRRLPRAIRADLDDSKRLVSHADVAVGEAWARVLSAGDARSPAELFEQLSLEGSSRLQQPCPDHVTAQCWAVTGESFQAEPELVERIAGHRAALAARGIELLHVKSSVHCTKRLNQARAAGRNRFVADLHAMEELVLALRERAGSDVHAVCGKVGGMGQYSKFFGPLSGHLHAILGEGQAASGYRFPRLGEIHFVRDADASDPLVSLASLVGKYVRELLMGRISRHYADDGPAPSGYHDPITAGFIERTALTRRTRRVPDGCFERERDPLAPELASERRIRERRSAEATREGS
jgi:ribonuclease HII